ncbi:ornithine cyclodeaminase [Reticulibacter mediterranei]|uniref:Ornithine cyclodeaminase n=1 Tax=Reticulibacter mediterranei TaxID=2778369 RepID=A0A8J3IHI4_9CHLR|nr:ornithine cyclodeaminase family protein [Reticulibacter mediterranei]GHO91572.1 ornithine cyclodeaminase [Reticulibacter mediterranei]
MALILSRSDIQQCFTMTDAIAAMRVAFQALSADQVQMPQRLAVELQDQGAVLLMPSVLHTNEGHAFGVKLVTQMPHNPERNLPRSYATILLLDAITGKTLAVLEGGWLTAMRTGAASGLATDLLAHPDADVLALFGAGAQAVTQVLAMYTVRPLREVRVLNRSDEHYQTLVMTLQQLLGEHCPTISRVHSANDALAGASLVVCATSATEPLFDGRDVEVGTHINAIGAFTPAMCELDGETLARAQIIVDQREAALIEAGDLLRSLAQGVIAGPESWLELGDLVTGKQPARQDGHEITVFKSVGLGMQDLAAALQLYQRARSIGIGVEVDL